MKHKEAYQDQHPLAPVPNWGRCNLRPLVVGEVGLVRFRQQENHHYRRRQLDSKQYIGWYPGDLLQLK
jgi:hypothetical protein